MRRKRDIIYISYSQAYGKSAVDALSRLYSRDAVLHSNLLHIHLIIETQY
jgi:hypothetical protein